MTQKPDIPRLLRDHTPWTDAEHDAAVAQATSRIDWHNRNRRRIANAGFFAATVSSTFLFLGRNEEPQLALICLAGVACLALILALRSGVSVRSVPCMLEEWKAGSGVYPLTSTEFLVLRSHACSDPIVQVTLERWLGTGNTLRRRDYEALVAFLRSTGLDVPELDRDIDESRWAEAL